MKIMRSNTKKLLLLESIAFQQDAVNCVARETYQGILHAQWLFIKNSNKLTI